MHGFLVRSTTSDASESDRRHANVITCTRVAVECCRCVRRRVSSSSSLFKFTPTDLKPALAHGLAAILPSLNLSRACVLPLTDGLRRACVRLLPVVLLLLRFLFLSLLLLLLLLLLLCCCAVVMLCCHCCCCCCCAVVLLCCRCCAVRDGLLLPGS